jgi:hypothetical protein
LSTVAKGDCRFSPKRGFDKLSLSGWGVDFKALFPFTLSLSKGVFAFVDSLKGEERSGTLHFVVASLLLVMATLSGCGFFSGPRPETEHRPAPSEREKGAQKRAAPSDRASPAVGKDVPEKGTFGTPLPPVAPSPLATIDAATPPQVAAATRLAHEGRTLLSAGQDDAALEALERAISVDPSNAYAYYFLAELHFRHNSYDQAIAFADRAALLSARLDGTWLTRSYALQGQALEAAGRTADARSAYRRALVADRRNQTARAGLDRVDKKQGMDREAPGD